MSNLTHPEYCQLYYKEPIQKAKVKFQEFPGA